MAVEAYTPALELAQAYVNGVAYCDDVADEDAGSAFEYASTAWDALTETPVRTRQDADAVLSALRTYIVVACGGASLSASGQDLRLLDRVCVYLRSDA